MKTGRPRLLTEEQEQEAITLYVEGEIAMSAIGERYGCSGETIRRTLVRNGIEIRHHRTGWHHSEETKRKISSKSQEHYRHLAELGIPNRRRCSKCKRWKDAEDFSWVKRRLVSGECRLHLASRCKKCESAKSAEWRSRQGTEEMRERWRKYEKSRRNRRKIHRHGRLPFSQEFADWYFRLKRSRRFEFLRPESLNSHHMPDDSFIGIFDSPRWAIYLGFESAEKLDNFERGIRNKTKQKTLDPAVVDQVLTAAGFQHLMVVFWGEQSVVNRKSVA
jgi:hypothetical protein